MSIRAVVFLAAALCALPLGGLAAQQASEPAKVPEPALTESVNLPADPLPAATSIMLQRPAQLPPVRLTPAPAMAVPAAQGQHVIVVSTLALVLGVALLVVLLT